MAPEIAPGKIWMGFKNLTPKDLHSIIKRIRTPRRYDVHPRKCRRLSKLSSTLASIPSQPITYFNIVGNQSLGDAGMQHLHLLPDTIIDLDLSSCDVGPHGAKLICDYLKTNKTIKRMIMWGNRFGDEGALHIAEMLKVNNTIEELCISANQIDLVGYEAIGDALMINTELSRLDMTNGEKVGDEHLLRLCPGLILNRGLQTLNMKNCLVTEKGLRYLLFVLRSNYSLEHFGCSQIPEWNSNDPDAHIKYPFIPSGQGSVWSKICYYFKLNHFNRELLYMEDTTVEELQEAVVDCAAAQFLDAIYLFVRNRPDILKGI